MKNLLLLFLPLAILLGTLVYRYDHPKKPKGKLTGRGGDFSE